MAYKATVCNVMIASPSDVQEERDIARKVLWNWNSLHSERTGIVLLPVGWETHSAPAMGDRAQAIINKQVLQGCDLLIGIFWTRLGTRTGQEDSGTVEEIKNHLKTGKPTMLYFSSAPIRPDSVDSEQYERLQTFKDEWKAAGLICDYETRQEFETQLTRHLLKTVSDDEYFKKLGADSAIPPMPEATRAPVPGQELSKEGRELLLEAVQDRGGSVLRVMTSGGLTIQTNGKNMVTSPEDARCEAVWEAALNELSDTGLLEDRGYKGEVFRVTRDGYELADLLKAAG